jgi:hypothetical protein
MLNGFLNPDWEPYNQPMPPSHEHITWILPEIEARTLPQQNIDFVRWVLYFPGILAGPATYPEHEMVVSFAPEYTARAKEAAGGREVTELFLPCVDLPETPDLPIKRPFKAVFWRHKGPNVLPPHPNYLEVTRDWPAERKEMIALLRQAQEFYTSDPHTAMLQEAQLCGCACFLWKDESWKPWHDPFAAVYIADEKSQKVEVYSFLERVDAYFGRG